MKKSSKTEKPAEKSAEKPAPKKLTVEMLKRVQGGRLNAPHNRFVAESASFDSEE